MHRKEPVSHIRYTEMLYRTTTNRLLPRLDMLLICKREFSMYPPIFRRVYTADLFGHWSTWTRPYRKYLSRVSLNLIYVSSLLTMDPHTQDRPRASSSHESMDPQRNYSSVRLWSYRSIYELLICFSVTSVPLRLLGPALNKIFNDCVPRLCIDYDGHNWGGKSSS